MNVGPVEKAVAVSDDNLKVISWLPDKFAEVELSKMLRRFPEESYPFRVNFLPRQPAEIWEAVVVSVAATPIPANWIWLTWKPE